MTASARHPEIGILVYPGVQLAAVHGLTDLLTIAANLDAASGTGRGLSITHWSAGPAGVAPDRGERDDRARPIALVVPPTLSDLPEPQTIDAIGRFLRAEHGRGVELVSVCSGVFLVAASGLLEGRIVSTHPGCARELARTFPTILVDTDARMIAHPGILTAGGFMAWVDVGLLLIGRLLGEAVEAETARFALAGRTAEAPPPPSADLELLRADLEPLRAHGDAAIRKAQEHVHLRDGRDVTLAAMASAAGLERRTFLRRFQSATGLTPIEYCRAVRIARAREFVEDGHLPLKRIAEKLGYADVSAFAKAFRRAYGTPPGLYRKERSAEASAR
ncbi:helix-turn-helix domain-containing protein [Kaistia geumhonensis]|uniref:Transcriptional regulator GlxA family with amidase domain n=1 Tax=Kaistia geumhonensis TaxID=410839 RepID=A0ABU0M789_9HYPH|nr:helix-turn-helix domain-containing protein [Kaistia geumhonensis]MCX5478094.1 helix-turn-helix domain-containing protein [Kaistia geumhonensis]MDQ0516690.1 transcriptional regulator GlxA family with amidase domain [Kaistia geumhonensis]